MKEAIQKIKARIERVLAPIIVLLREQSVTAYMHDVKLVYGSETTDVLLAYLNRYTFSKISMIDFIHIDMHIYVYRCILRYIFIFIHIFIHIPMI
jgi:uncharacterized protein (UPF0261 family)